MNKNSKHKKKNNYNLFYIGLISGISLIVFIGILLVGLILSNDNSYFARIRVAIKKKVQIVYNQNLFDGSIINNSGIKEYDSDKQVITFDGKLEGKNIDLGKLNINVKKGERYRVTINYLSGSYDKEGKPNFIFELQKNGNYYEERKNETHYISGILPTKKDKPIDKVLTIKDEVVDATNIIYRIYQDNEVEFKNYKIQVLITKLESKIGVAGDKYGKLPTPEKDGYEFLGWYDSISGGKKVTETNTILKKYNHPLYAHWQKNKSFPVVQPLDNGKIVFEEDTPTLKVKIQQRSDKDHSTYYLTYIWVEDPYNQNSKAQAENYPNKLQYTENMLNAEVKKEGLENKLVIATNASAYYNNSYNECARIWDKGNKEAGYEKYGIGKESMFCYPAWTNSNEYSEKYKNTQVGNLVITKGQIIRNWPSQDAVDKTRVLDLYGIDKDGTFRVFRGINAGTEESRTKLYKEIINTGIKNSVVWYVPIILDGKVVGWANSKNKNNITAFCQINKNNFVIFSCRNTVYNYLVPENFSALGCQNAVNFDGGGSVEILYKSKKDKTVNRLITSYSDRENAEVYYFTEK
jgi:uncharacterized repeat protein (TIGR02543 family)